MNVTMELLSLRASGVVQCTLGEEVVVGSLLTGI